MANIYKVTSFMSLNTGEGSRIAFTFSVIDEKGNVVSQNNKGNYMVMDEEEQKHVDAIRENILARIMGK